MKIIKVSTSNRYDSLANTIIRKSFSKIKDMISCFYSDKSSQYHVANTNITINGVDLSEIRFFIQASDNQDLFTLKDYHVGGGFWKNPQDNSKTIILVIISLNEEVTVRPIRNNDLEQLHFELSITLRHELEHFRQYNMKNIDYSNVSGSGMVNNPKEAREYYFHKDEVGAYIREAIYRMRKNPGTTLVDNLMNIFDTEFEKGFHSGSIITDEGQEWCKLYKDIQHHYFQVIKSEYSWLSPSEIGNMTIKELL